MDEAPEAAADAVTDESITVTLSKPIPVFDEKFTSLKFRKPTAGDIIQIGNPVLFDPISDPPRVEHHAQRMTAMMARLSGVPASSLAKLETEDWIACAWELSPFFIPRRARI
jgi:hypothetical protein